MTKRCVYVVDDEEPIRRSVQLILRLMGFEASTFDSGVAFLQGADRLRPGCVLLDIRMPDMDGLEVQRRLNTQGAAHSVVVMSGHGDLSVAVPTFESGAVAFLEKPFPRAALQQALEIAFLELEDTAGYCAYLAEAERSIGTLGPAEQEILTLLTRGHTNEQIAAALDIAAPAVEISRARVFEQLQVETITDALRLAFAATRSSEAP